VSDRRFLVQSRGLGEVMFPTPTEAKVGCNPLGYPEPVFARPPGYG
jgi:hypothetical protein